MTFLVFQISDCNNVGRVCKRLRCVALSLKRALTQLCVRGMGDSGRQRAEGRVRDGPEVVEGETIRYCLVSSQLGTRLLFL